MSFGMCGYAVIAGLVAGECFRGAVSVVLQIRGVTDDVRGAQSARPGGRG